MTDKERLLRSIIENPNEDTPRLMYADYLEENGEIERAEFIRVQIERVPLKEPLSGFHGCIECEDGSVDGMCRYHFLQHREYHLWQKHFPTQADWDLPIGGLKYAWQVTPISTTQSSHPVAILRRGFVDEVRLDELNLFGGQLYSWDPASDTRRATRKIPGLAEELFQRHPITQVVLSEKSPLRSSAGYEWRSDADVLIANVRYWMVSDEVLRASPDNELWTVVYESEKAARRALSTACVLAGRARAKRKAQNV